MIAANDSPFNTWETHEFRTAPLTFWLISFSELILSYLPRSNERAGSTVGGRQPLARLQRPSLTGSLLSRKKPGTCMKALRFEKTGSLDELKIQEVQRPMPGPGSLLVAVKAAGLNPSDAKNVLGRMHQTKVPRIPGRDFAGIVAVGTEAYPVGMEVFGSGGALGFARDGSHAEYVEVPAEAVQPKPRALTFEQAAIVGIPYLTAWRAIVDVASLKEGETVFITGTTGAVGDAAARIAKYICRATVIGTARRHTDAVRQKLLDYIDGLADLSAGAISLPEQIRAETGGQGVNVVFDVVGGSLFDPCLRCLALGVAK